MNNIIKLIDPVYRGNLLELFRLLVVFVCGAYVCYLTDQIFAFLSAILYYSISIRSIVTYLEKKAKSQLNDS